MMSQQSQWHKRVEEGWSKYLAASHWQTFSHWFILCLKWPWSAKWGATSQYEQDDDYKLKVDERKTEWIRQQRAMERGDTDNEEMRKTKGQRRRRLCFFRNFAIYSDWYASVYLPHGSTGTPVCAALSLSVWKLLHLHIYLLHTLFFFTKKLFVYCYVFRFI